MDYRLLVPSKNKIINDILSQLMTTKEARICDIQCRKIAGYHLSDLRKKKLVDFYRGNDLLIKAPVDLMIVRHKKGRCFDYVFTINHEVLRKL